MVVAAVTVLWTLVWPSFCSRPEDETSLSDPTYCRGGVATGSEELVWLTAPTGSVEAYSFSCLPDSAISLSDGYCWLWVKCMTPTISYDWRWAVKLKMMDEDPHQDANERLSGFRSHKNRGTS